METFLDRFSEAFSAENERRASFGLARVTYSELARIAGVSNAAVSNWKSGKDTPKLQNCLLIGRKLGVSGRWLFDGTQPRVLGSGGEPEKGNIISYNDLRDKLPDGYIVVPQYNITIHAGVGDSPPTINSETETTSRAMVYTAEWLAREGIATEHAKRFRVHGRSMEPLLHEGDSVLVNTAENAIDGIINGAVYAFRHKDTARVKRLYLNGDGSLILASDNPSYNTETIPQHAVASTITLIGRVREKCGAGGLNP